MSPIIRNMLAIFFPQTTITFLLTFLLLLTTTLSHPHPQSNIPTSAVTNTVTDNYTLLDDYTSSPETFFSLFTFFTDIDPTRGFVDYKDGLSAAEAGLIGYIPPSPNNPTTTPEKPTIYLGVDYTTVLPTPNSTSSTTITTRGRPSVRLTSLARYNSGTLLIADISHMPAGCGTWPSLWLVGGGSQENVWPMKGELDLIEGVNLKGENTVSLHTSEGCVVDNATLAEGTGMDDAAGVGTLLTDNCNVAAANQSPNQGCSIALPASPSSPTYGTPFNSANGGIYALLWTTTGFDVWFFSHSNTNTTIPQNSPTIPPSLHSLPPTSISSSEISAFGSPHASFHGPSCDFPAHFKDMAIVFDTTFCGDWAGGSDWETGGCAAETGYARCENFVAEMPGVFREAWWGVRGLWVFGLGE